MADQKPSRRRLLGTLAVGASVGVTGCTQVLSELGEDEPTPTADSQKVVVDVTVLDEDGEPVADEPVVLEDRGGSPDTRQSRTGPEGSVRFIEGVGPPPCNTQTVRLPQRGKSKSLGCNNGGVRLEHTFQVGGGPSGEGTATVGDQKVGVTVTVLDESGEPVADEPVLLIDSGGSLDQRTARTGSDGQVRFVEGVGPPPCNPMDVELPDRGRSVSLGCQEGGTTTSHTFRIERR